jgi:D-sedoheptulose 7-phosphate isomerase
LCTFGENYVAMQELIKQNLREAAGTLEKFINQPENLAAVGKAAGIMAGSVSEGRKIISCGNGGSMSDAMHFAGELTGRFKHERPALPALSISEPAYLTSVGNDYGFDNIFSRFIEGVGSAGDVLLAISTSGNSPNIIKAAEAALQKGMKVVALTGKTGGLLANLADVEIRVDGGKYSDRIQEVHIKVLHILVDLIEKEVLG